MEHDPMCSVPVSYLNMLQGLAQDERKHVISWQSETVVPGQPATYDAMAASREELLQAHSKVLATLNKAELELGVDLDDIPDGYLKSLTEPARLRDERDEAWARIAAFEERAGCALEHIPVEKLNAAQDAHVMQSAVDELKRENERLGKECNALGSELCDWRGKFKEAERKLAGAPEQAPYGLRKDGTPKAKPGRKVPRRRKAA